MQKARTLSIVFTVPEDRVGGLLADLSGRVETLSFHVVEEAPRRGVLQEGILRVLAAGPSTTGEIKAALPGSNSKSVQNGLTTLRRKGVIKHGTGNRWMVKAG
jgi:hypothetical protein